MGGPPTTIDLASLGTAGTLLYGVDPDDEAGRAVSCAGDVNGDGFDDILISADRANGVANAETYSGEST